MASSLQFLLLFSFIFLIPFSVSQRPSRLKNAIVFPVTKDVSTLQYWTHIHKGTPLVPIKLVVDLGGPYLWVDCASEHVSSSHRAIQCGSLQCSRSNANGCSSSTNTHTCILNTVTTITRVATRGELAEDIVAVEQVDGSDQMGSITTVDHFLFSCAPSLLLKGLANGAKGMLGLGRTRIALPSQLAGIHRKFAICLSSSDGVILSGDRPRILLFWPDVWNSLTYTPLISNQFGTLQGYYINLKSIKVNGKQLSLNTSLFFVDRHGIGGIKLSTVVPYTTMESTIYDTFTKAYLKVAISMNMIRVASVPPFRVCFSSNGIDKTPAGPTVPTVDLVLQSEMVKWRIYGRNSMVQVSDEVMCLGFLDGGLSPRTSIVIGGYQLEDYLLEFNLATSMLGFSSSLFMRQTSCSDFKLYSMPSESV